MASDKIVTNPDLKAVTLAVLRAGFSEYEETKVKVGINSPEGPNLLPFIAINLLGDSETASHIGDSLADEVIDDAIYAGIAAEWTQQVEVKLWSNSADERDRLGPLLKSILFAGRGTSANPGPFSNTPGLECPKIGGGYDEGITITSEQFGPQAVYMRTYILTANTSLVVFEPAGSQVEMIRATGEVVDIDAETFEEEFVASYAGG